MARIRKRDDPILRNKKKLLSRSFKHWAQTCSENDQLYEKNPRRRIALGLTDEFREGFRPFFLHLFEKLYCEEMAFKDLAVRVRIIPGSEEQPTRSTIIGIPEKATKEMLISNVQDIKDMVCYIANLEIAKGRSPPPQVKQFVLMCREFLSRGSQEMEDLRAQVYFILKNPLIYTVTESMLFLEKAIHLHASDEKKFENDVPFEALNFIKRIDEKTMQALYQVSIHGDSELPDEEKEKRREARYSRTGAQALVFAGDIYKHFAKKVKSPGRKRSVTLGYIYSEMTECVLYDLVAVAFRGIALAYAVLPITIGEKEVNTFIFSNSSLLEYMEEDPQVIWPLCNRKYGWKAH